VRVYCMCGGGEGGEGGGRVLRLWRFVMQEAIGCTDDVFKTLFFYLEWICELNEALP